MSAKMETLPYLHGFGVGHAHNPILLYKPICWGKRWWSLRLVPYLLYRYDWQSFLWSLHCKYFLFIYSPCFISLLIFIFQHILKTILLKKELMTVDWKNSLGTAGHIQLLTENTGSKEITQYKSDNMIYRFSSISRSNRAN